MSDLGRKDFSDKAKEGVTPDSSKSTVDKVKEAGTDTTDKLSRSVQPEGNKSATQKVSDSVGGTKDDAAHGGTGESILDKTKGALGMDKK